jgi:hypothetical protein
VYLTGVSTGTEKYQFRTEKCQFLGETDNALSLSQRIAVAVERKALEYHRTPSLSLTLSILIIGPWIATVTQR